MQMFLADRHGNIVQRDVLQQHMAAVPKLDIRAEAAAPACDDSDSGENDVVRWTCSAGAIESLSLKATSWQLHKDKALLVLAPDVSVTGSVVLRERAGRESRWGRWRCSATMAYTGGCVLCGNVG
jgi:hypothetical protein